MISKVDLGSTICERQSCQLETNYGLFFLEQSGRGYSLEGNFKRRWNIIFKVSSMITSNLLT
ncbi:hypothetical protein DM860_013818 [Cuscuta australis]|uniref:Uncharacterized protein n=1 Tax=Cuscuta australis TaxID=267555 RepID=A0A328DI09_9ASTE|nr:hypothetical protein DM860_013818 [Cuscuta australis]